MRLRDLATLTCTLAFVTACPAKPEPTFKKPNDELIVGDFARRPPDGAKAIRFTPGRAYRITQTKAVLDKEPPLASGSYQLEGDTLTFTAERGECADADATKVGTYKVVISKIGIRYAKLEDACEQRNLDGQTWWRL